MLTISSIGVAPRPPQAPVVNVQPVSPVKPSNAVNQGGSGVPVPTVPSGDGNRVQTAFVPGSLPPVDPAREAQQAEIQKNNLPAEAQRALAGQAAARERYKGELPPEPKNPAQARIDKQVEELIPNVWAASRAAVDALIGENLEAAVPARAAPETATYDGQAKNRPPASPGSLLDVEV